MEKVDIVVKQVISHSLRQDTHEECLSQDSVKVISIATRQVIEGILVKFQHGRVDG